MPRFLAKTIYIHANLLNPKQLILQEEIIIRNKFKPY